ncbi:HD-domain/PDEase-like protein [Phlegmacium glaucopus]|nr:HD-domain/PDEase-like protein [Phlegmacium glaucopus]
MDEDEMFIHYPKAPVRQIKDTIYDQIPISPTLSRFIDTKQFQRLRNIKQLGTTSYVWPGASHTRFEHSLGVAYLARMMATHIQSQKELEITDRDVGCIELAGLCHDLGHGPWSHVWDNLFIPAALKDKQWSHEDGSEIMFDYLVRDNNIPIPMKDQQFIKALIAGQSSRTPDEKSFLFDIVANKRNGLDVDKIDYIHRDSHMLGDPIHLSPVRLVNSARVLDNQICYHIKDANHIYDICYARFKMHKICYNHKAAVSIEYMIIDALLSADPHLNIANRVFEPERYLHLTDTIMPLIEATTEPELAQARAIFDRIRTRDLYKCVDFKVIDWPMRSLFQKHITAARIVEACRALPTPTTTEDGGSLSTTSLQESDVIVSFVLMHFGMKEKNPLDFIRFYSKQDYTRSYKAQRGDYSGMTPQWFGEDLLRVYTKKPQFFGLVQAGYRAVLATMPNEFDLTRPETSAIPDPMAPTPPSTETEAPSTPKADGHSRNSSFTFSSAPLSATTTPFSNNSFTTVPPSFAPSSPPRNSKKRRSATGKRLHEDSKTFSRDDDNPKKKQKQWPTK